MKDTTTIDRLAAKETTRNEIQALCGREPEAVRVLTWMNGAQREEGEVVQMLTALNMEREDLDEADEQKIEQAIGFLGWMVTEEWLTSKLVGIEMYYAPGSMFLGRNTI